MRPYTLFLGRCVCFDHINEAVDLGSQGRDGGGEYGIELAKVGKLARDICGKRVEILCVF